MTYNIFHHGSRNEGFSSSIRFSPQQFFTWQFCCQSKGSQGIHNKIHPQHLDSFQGTVLKEKKKEKKENKQNMQTVQ